VLNDPLSVPAVLSAHLLATGLVVALMLREIRRSRPPGWSAAAPQDARRTAWRTAGGFIAMMVAAALNERIDMLMLGWTAPGPEIASYAVATRFSQAVVVAVNAVAAVMAPQFVERLAELAAGRRARVQALVRGTARTTLWLTLAALLSFAALGHWLDLLFGPHYRQAYGPLLVLAAGQVGAALFGPAMLACALAGAPRIGVSCLGLAIVANAALNLLLAPRLGALGAAIATAASATLAAGAAWAWTRRRLSPSSFTRTAARR